MGLLRRKKSGSDSEPEVTGDWYADPYGKAARRWYEPKSGWSDRTQGDGEEPDKTGVARLDEAAVTPVGAERPSDEEGEPVPLSRPADATDLME